MPWSKEFLFHWIFTPSGKYALFRGDDDFIYFKNLCAAAQRKFNLKIHHYCLLEREIQIFASLPQNQKPRAVLQEIETVYARYYRKNSPDRRGPVLRRIWERGISSESYFLQCGRYIERRAVTAGLVMDPWQYRHSSARHLALGHPDELVAHTYLYEQLAHADEDKQRAYRSLIHMEEPYTDLIDKAWQSEASAKA